MPFVFTSVGVEDNHPPVTITVGDIDFIGCGIRIDLRRPPEVEQVVTSVMSSLFADLQQELTLLVEFQNLRVGVSIAANPNVSLVIDGDAVITLRPFVSRAGTSPGVNEIPLRIKLEDGRCDLAANPDRR